MKKITKRIAMLMIFVLLVCNLSGCGTTDGATDTENDSTSAYTDFDVDLTSLSSTVVYAEVSNMMTNPDKYEGKTVRMSGTFSVYEGEAKIYYACLIADATACCSQGIEFVLDGDFSYPDDYPELGSEITVSGIFDTYYEGEYMYVQLIDAEMTTA
ncbi:MAG: hypothetical protein LUI14_14705 [Lachnospiraceae bacterium]|nr:hypothetical protein [Lachnospiraceae bacterium]MCD7765955.1 hypothetical protein [Lachnospiraceae bacterium]